MHCNTLFWLMCSIWWSHQQIMRYINSATRFMFQISLSNVRELLLFIRSTLIIFIDLHNMLNDLEKKHSFCCAIYMITKQTNMLCVKYNLYISKVFIWVYNFTIKNIFYLNNYAKTAIKLLCFFFVIHCSFYSTAYAHNHNTSKHVHNAGHQLLDRAETNKYHSRATQLFRNVFSFRSGPDSRTVEPTFPWGVATYAWSARPNARHSLIRQSLAKSGVDRVLLTHKRCVRVSWSSA